MTQLIPPDGIGRSGFWPDSLRAATLAHNRLHTSIVLPHYSSEVAMFVDGALLSSFGRARP